MFNHLQQRIYNGDTVRRIKRKMWGGIKCNVKIAGFGT